MSMSNLEDYKPQVDRPNCHKCVNRDPLPMTHHIQCLEPKALISGNARAAQKGWFNWPWKGLTEEERKEIWNVGEKKDQAWRALLIQTIRDVETKLKERNT